MFIIVGGLIGFAIEPNMARLMADVQEGTLDYLLTRPADTQLLVSVRGFRIWRLTDVFLFVATLGFGVVMIYCVWLMLSTGAFWFVRMEMLQELFTGLYRAGQCPVGLYPGWLQAGLTFLVPIGFAVTVRMESLTSRLTLGRVAVMPGVFFALITLTRLGWQRVIRRYDGASA